MRPITFIFGSQVVRALEIEGRAWFVGRDVALALGYLHSTSALREHCRGHARYHRIIDVGGRRRAMRILSETDVFRVIALSSRGEVREFERWLVEVVLPAMFGADQRERPSPESDAHRLRRELLLKLIGEDLSNQARRSLYQQLEQVLADLERDRTARPESHPADSLRQLRQQFWGALVPSDLASLNHAHQPNLLAINLPETLATVRSAGFPWIHVNVVRRALRSDPDFVRVAAIYSESYRRTIKCWMFHARDRSSTQSAAAP